MWGFRFGKRWNSLDRVNLMTQVFGNKTDEVMFIFLEPSTSRFCLFPGQELVLHYKSDDTASGHKANLSVELCKDGVGMQFTIYTWEDNMFHLDGRQAEMCFATFEEMKDIYQQRLLNGLS